MDLPGACSFLSTSWAGLAESRVKQRDVEITAVSLPGAQRKAGGPGSERLQHQTENKRGDTLQTPVLQPGP